MSKTNKKANREKNKARKKELYDLLVRSWRERERSDRGPREAFNIGPYPCRCDFGAIRDAFWINFDGREVGVMYSWQKKAHHWLGSIPTDADMMKLRLYG